MKRNKTKVNHMEWSFLIIALVSLSVTILAIYLSYYFASPIDLEIWHNISDEDGRLHIFGKNNDRIRSTGVIDLYRIEVNPHKPHIQIPKNEELGPGEERKLFELQIHITESDAQKSINNVFESLKISMSEAYFLTENQSISYKIMCENCKNQGIVRREPDFQKIKLIMVLQQDGFVGTNIPKYSWAEAGYNHLILNIAN